MEDILLLLVNDRVLLVNLSLLVPALVVQLVYVFLLIFKLSAFVLNEAIE